jgi:hypothetical protein
MVTGVLIAGRTVLALISVIASSPALH